MQAYIYATRCNGLPVGQVVTIPEHHGRESGMIGRIEAIERTAFGTMYRLHVPVSFGERSVPVPVPVPARLLDRLEWGEGIG